MGNAPEPDTKRFWNRDLYTHIKWGRVSDPEADEDGWMGGRKHDLMRRDSLVIGRSMLALDSISAVTHGRRSRLLWIALGQGPRRRRPFQARGWRRRHHLCGVVHRAGTAWSSRTWSPSKTAGIKVRIDGFRPAPKPPSKPWCGRTSPSGRDFIVMQATVFPQINLLWLGCLIMTTVAP